MKVIQGFPPNHHAIKEFIPHREGNVYCYGSEIYSPDSAQIPEDILFHESIHKTQQERFTSPESWWLKYCHDKDFRLKEEVEAYAEQYKWVRKHIHPTAAAHMLQEATMNLTDIYGFTLSYGEAHSLIRHRAKK